jgi:TPR repeat protein
MYFDGQGVPQDYVLAHKWLNLAAAQGGMRSDTAVKARDNVASQMTPEQIAEAQRLAREWMAAFEKRKKK